MEKIVLTRFIKEFIQEIQRTDDTAVGRLTSGSSFSHGYGAVRMWSVCGDLLYVLLYVHYAFIKRTN